MNLILTYKALCKSGIFQFIALKEIEGGTNWIVSCAIIKIIFEAILLCEFWHILWKRFKELSDISIQDSHFHILANVNQVFLKAKIGIEIELILSSISLYLWYNFKSLIYPTKSFISSKSLLVTFNYYLTTWTIYLCCFINIILVLITHSKRQYYPGLYGHRT